ncbi:enoyl-CoA hydratase/isomerase family protein [Gordonia sp. CPCC 205515]|uniref:enoyl-CoA hydratase/isomerase family protein n=1 Tax=Gordonia sp. CPCC 205515 TaxID=3140791 RepID=UPI003AF3390B
MTTSYPVISVAELAESPAVSPLLDATAGLVEPVVIVDLDDADPELAQRAAERVADLDRVLVGRAHQQVDDGLYSLTSALDLTYVAVDSPPHRSLVGVVDVDAAVESFVDVADRLPQSTLVAAQVVRASESLTVPAAVDVESFGYSTLQGGDEYRRWLEERQAKSREPRRQEFADDPVLIERVDDILRLTLNRPTRRNAYSAEIRDALVDALRIPLLDSSIQRIVLDGAGPSFCAGGDLDEFGHMPDAVTAHFIRTRGGAARLMGRLADRIEVRLHGHCVGAGIEIPAFAGRVVAEPDTVIRLPEVSMGLIPGAGGTVSVPRRIGRWRALHLFVTGAPLNAEQALAWGLVDEVG